MAFTDAAVAGSDAEREETRLRLFQDMGPAALVDAAAVVANFERMTRIADGTGIPLDAQVNTLSAEIQQRLDLRRFASAANTRATGPVWRWISALAGPVAFRAMKRIGALGRRARED